MLSSNDYLGLSHHPKIKEAGKKALEKWGSSTTGARLANGGRIFHQDLEEKLASFLGKEACHVFSAGYLACASAVTGFSDRRICSSQTRVTFFPLERNQIEQSHYERFAPTTPLISENP